MIENEASKIPVYRHTDRPEGFIPASGESEIDRISEHIEKHLGKIDSVFHEIISELVHIDIHYVKPSDRFPFHILVSSGMSDKSMNVPDELSDHRFAEICLLLPLDWPINNDNYKLLNEVFKDDNSYWPIKWMKIIARFPHEYNTWIGWGHTIPNGELAEPFADNTKLGCMLIMPSISLPRDFFELKINSEKTIKFYCLYPLYKEEMEYRLKVGTDKLLDKFDNYKIKDVLSVDRPNVCLKKGLFGLW